MYHSTLALPILAAVAAAAAAVNHNDACKMKAVLVLLRATKLVTAAGSSDSSGFWQ
jgi:hypothetical protein